MWNKWTSGKGNIYYKNCKIVVAYVTKLKSVKLITNFLYFETVHLDANEGVGWPRTTQPTFTSSKLTIETL